MAGAITSDARIRAVLLVVYLVILALVQAQLISSGLTLDNKAIWLVSGVVSLLFGSRLINPHFTPPADSLTNAIAALLAILPAVPAIPSGTWDALVLGTAIGLFALVSLVSLLVLIFRASPGQEQSLPWQVCEKAVKGLGSPNIIYTVVIIVAVWLFHRQQPLEVFAILTTLAVITIIRPLESIVDYIGAFWNHGPILRREDIVGTVAAHQSPGIVLIRQLEPKTIERGTAMVVADQHGPDQLGVALNYVGRDEGNLLRVLTAPLPASLASYAGQLPAKSQDAIAISITVPPEEKAQIQTLQWIGRLCGIVDSDSSTEYLQFEVINDIGLAEGSLVEARIGDERQVIYQVIDGFTREEVVQQKNKYGYARAKARKIGTWDADAQKFNPVPWLPRINAPVFMLENEDVAPEGDCVGYFPSTPYGVRLDPSECVTHNTAILGILGVGKSYLSIELVERMIAQGIKVLCLDLTNQYEQLLADFIDPAHEQVKRDELIEAGKGGVAHQNRELGGSCRAFKLAVVEQMREFLAEDDDHYLRVYNPAKFRVTKQVSGMFQGNAELSHLTASEITAIFSDAALFVCQELGMTDSARLCIVYEEAHSLVPEWNSVAADGDKQATATSARAILQGRKYGLGCLLITQRTANVTKTILNQCNTIFAMRTFDDTGKYFLGNYIGSDYANVLSSLQPRHAVVFGKASSCENPVLIRLNDQADFRQRFRPNNPPRQPQPAPPVEGEAEDDAIEGAAGTDQAHGEA
jgi:uncharacterized protein